MRRSEMTNEGTTLYLGAFVDELVRSGLKHIVVSPGSRSTPIAILAAEHPELKVWIQIDERSAAFFALGLAKSSRQAVALLCTSGTAAANYYPAIAEANLSRVPLIVLTADRPHELRDVGAPQTIDQLGMYGSHVKWFMEMPLPEKSPAMLRHARVMASRAVMTSQSAPRGVVHLNFPLREPLLPDIEHPQLYNSERTSGTSYTSIYAAKAGLDAHELNKLAAALIEAERGLIICGPHDDPALAPLIVELAERLGYPIVADPLSQLRNGAHSKQLVIDSYDSFLRVEAVKEELVPDVLLRFGAMPVSKPLLQYMNKHTEARHIVIDEAGWRDPTLLISDRVLAEPITLCEQLNDWLTQHDTNRRAADSSWLKRWQQVQLTTAQVLSEAAEKEYDSELFEGTAVAELQQLMKHGSTLFVGNSMPIRDVDSFWRNDARSVRVMANRGANGIDGLVSTAMGISALEEGTVLLLGDLSFYHDLNGLLGAKLHQLNITIVVINNDGGGIFSFLPQAGMDKHFELLFGTPIGLDYEHAAKLYDGAFTRTGSWEQFRAAFIEAQQAGGLHIIEIPTTRATDVNIAGGQWPVLEQRLQQQKG